MPSFLNLVDWGERVIVKSLTVITVVVIIAALIQLIVNVGNELFVDSQQSWLGDDLIKVLGDLLTVLIALEVLQNVTSYLRRHVVQIELVLVTALTAVARKVIVLPPGSDDKPQLLAGLGIASIALAGAYWLVKRVTIDPALSARSRTKPTKLSQGEDQFVPHDADGEGPNAADLPR